MVRRCLISQSCEDSCGCGRILLTEYSITCRRRHVKCDENRPHCDRCRKGNQTCIYADPHAAQPQSPQAASRQPSAPLSESRQRRLSDLQQRAPSVLAWPNSPEQAMIYQAGQPAPSETGRASITSLPPERQTSQISLGQRAPSQNDYLRNTVRANALKLIDQLRNQFETDKRCWLLSRDTDTRTKRRPKSLLICNKYIYVVGFFFLLPTKLNKQNQIIIIFSKLECLTFKTSRTDTTYKA